MHRTKKLKPRPIVVSHETLLRLIATRGRIEAPEDPPPAPPTRFVVVPARPVKLA